MNTGYTNDDTSPISKDTSPTAEQRSSASDDTHSIPEPVEIFPASVENIKTTHKGDRVIRIHRPSIPGVRRVMRGVYKFNALPEPKSRIGRILHRLSRFLIGTPIRSEYEQHERLTKIKALGVFASDNISSSAYATEEIMRVLILAGLGAISLTLPLTAGIIALLTIVTISYNQTIKAYPSGGGSYIVAMDNLGVLPGLVAGTALLIDYVLTVAVSIAAGVAAVTSAFPVLYPERVGICVAAILIITVGNLRGIRESGNIFAFPVYIYLVSILGAMAYGLIRVAFGTLPSYLLPVHTFSTATNELGLFLVLRAFSSGAVALTGVEAISNGIPAFTPPETRNARITLYWMAASFALIFAGVSFFAIRLGIIPDPNEVETIVSLIVRKIVGTGWYYYIVQFSTAILLVLAANTSFADFPRLASIMARDKFLPTQLTFRGERLAFNNGIIMLAGLAAALIVIFKGSVTNLIPLYTIGVFIAFTLSQIGMVVRWMRRHEPGWRFGIILNSMGAIATAVVALVVGITKFVLGAWMILILIPILVMLLLGIRRHYQDLGDQLIVDLHNPTEHPNAVAQKFHHYIVIPVGDLTLPTVQAIAYARSITQSIAAHGDILGPVIQAVHVTDNRNTGQLFFDKWKEFNCGVPLVLLESPYRALVNPILRYLDALERQHKDGIPIITVLLPEFVPANWWEHFLHTQTGLLFKGTLLFRPRTVVISVPHHLGTNTTA